MIRYLKLLIIAIGICVIGAAGTLGWFKWQKNSALRQAKADAKAQAEADKLRWREWDIPTDPIDRAGYDFAHNLKLPEGKPMEAYDAKHQRVDIAAIPKPDPMGYCKEMKGQQCVVEKTPREYYEYLCEREAGEWYFQKAQNVEGLYLARPRHRPNEDEQMDRYRLEDPWSGARTYRSAVHLLAPDSGDYGGYGFVEAPKSLDKELWGIPQPLISGDKQVKGEIWHYDVAARDKNNNIESMRVSEKTTLEAKYGVTWRGIRRPFDRQNLIAGGEIIVYDLKTNTVMSVRRGFALSGNIRSHKSTIYWAGASRCPIYGTYINGGPRTVDLMTETLARKTLLISKP